MSLYDFYLLFGFTVPAPDFWPTGFPPETYVMMNYDRRGDARPAGDDDGTGTEVFKQ